MDYLIFSAMGICKRDLFCTSSHHNVPYEKQQEVESGLSLKISVLARARAQLLNMLHQYTPERTTWRKYLEECSIYIEIGTMYDSS